MNATASTDPTFESLVRKTRVLSIIGALEGVVSGLAYDSRRVAPGDLFFALRGTSENGGLFAIQAGERGGWSGDGSGSRKSSDSAGKGPGGASGHGGYRHGLLQ